MTHLATALPHPALHQTTLPRYRHALLLLATAAIVGMLLSALQIVPAVALTRQASGRRFTIRECVRDPRLCLTTD